MKSMFPHLSARLRAAVLVSAALVTVAALRAQPSHLGPVPATAPLERSDLIRQARLARIDEVLTWRIGAAKPGALFADMGLIAAKLARGEDAELCSRSVIALLKEPGSGPFWMFPSTCVAYLGRGQLSPEAQAAIRRGWRTTMQLRGDTENHWAMYYASLYLMAQLYRNEAADTWYSGKNSTDNFNEARDYLIHWMDLATTVGQGEFNPTHYIGEYAIPLLYLATWAEDPAMRLRARMMLDWLLADHAAQTLHGVLRGPNARTDDTSLIERWNALASFFSWLEFGNTPPPVGYGGWGIYYAVVARHYDLPEVIYRIATDRAGDYEQRDLKRTRRRWRNSAVAMAPIYKTNYLRRDYAVGSYQGGISDPIQAHVWDVTWAVADPRGVHNTMFSMHPVSSNFDMQMYFTELPDQQIKGVAKEGKPSYDTPEKLLGSSRFEQVFQDLDTVIALYDIPAGTRFPHINGFFSKDLADVVEDASGWIFARGGDTYLAYRPLAPYRFEPLDKFKSMWAETRVKTGDRRLVSPHLKNGTIVQAAAASEFKDYAAFQAAMRALPLAFALEPKPTVTFKTLRGKTVVCTYGELPVVDGRPFDYTRWKLFEGPYLNAEKGSRRLTITHGRLERVLDFNTLTTTDRVSR
jgi:hypothetical protein